MKISNKQYNYQRYQKHKKLGEGTYGSVIKVYDHQSKQIRALKKIKYAADDQGIPVNILRQVCILKNLNHPNLIKLYEVHYNYNEPEKLYLNLQYWGENLNQYLKINFPLSPYAIKSYLCQILLAINYLHQKGMMHRDLKTQNILITQDGKLKLCDFGQARMLTSLNQCQLTPQVGTLWYRAPQTLFGCLNYSFKVDLWAVGCIMVQLFTGHPYFKSNCEVGQIFQILTKRGGISRKKFPGWKNLSPDYPKVFQKKLQIPIDDELALDLLQKLLQIDPNKRIGAKDALKHPYFDGYY